MLKQIPRVLSTAPRWQSSAQRIRLQSGTPAGSNPALGSLSLGAEDDYRSVSIFCGFDEIEYREARPGGLVLWESHPLTFVRDGATRPALP